MLAAIAVPALLLLGAPGLPAAHAAPATASKIQLFDSHISHIVFLMQENHAFDNLYGTYCPTTGAYCSSAVNGIPSGVCIPKIPVFPSLGCVAPFDLGAHNLTLPSDLPHDWNASHRAIDLGRMDGFVASAGPFAMGHYNGSTVPVYWDLAEQYALADDFFSPVASYSLPNHWDAIAPYAPSASNIVRTLTALPTQQRSYLNQSNATPSIEDELANSSVSWKYYDFPLPTYTVAIAHSPTGVAYDYWNPMAARNQSYTAGLSSHFVNRTDILGDAANGTLPGLSWVMPSPPISDHPPYNLTRGEDWVAKVVDALEGSPEWNSTLLFVSWDEFGGFYDHVLPPHASGVGDGFRVPLLAVGPWVRQGYVDPVNMTFESILHLMEKRFHLGCLGPGDCRAPLPLSMFDFQRHRPRAPIYFPDFVNATYPMPLQSSGLLPPFPSVQSAPLSTWALQPLSPAEAAGIDWS